jgi:WhiB family redox-sensing transcriptional regulator
MPASMFFTPAEVRDDSRPERERMARAKQVCAACPVVIQCATHALREPELYGVWGGLTPKERERLRRRPASDTA